MATASQIIERCGGNKATADMLGLTRNAVQRWVYDSPEGLGDRVPMRQWAPLISAAAKRGITITLDELMPPAVASVAKAEARRKDRAA